MTDEFLISQKKNEIPLRLSTANFATQLVILENLKYFSL